MATCTTCGDNNIDLFYCNIKDSYKSIPLPPLGRSCHNLVSLVPRYLPRVQREPPMTHTVSTWTKEAWETLQGCFECTDWSVFIDSAGDVNTTADAVCDYINFCVDSVIPVRTVKIYSNNKPWVSKNIKHVLNRKKKAFEESDREELKRVQKELRSEIRKGKIEYRKKIEQNFQSGNMKKVWEGLKTMSGYKASKVDNAEAQTDDFANELNNFYARFDCLDFSTERDEIRKTLNFKRIEEQEHITICENQVFRVLRSTNPNKASGPDGVRPDVLRVCASQLCGIFCDIFNMSLCQCVVPSVWKKSCIVPVPKKNPVTCMNDLRPVALTSCVMKVFEKCILTHLKIDVAAYEDPLQFAYRENRGVEDAILHVLNNVYTHLENSNSCVRLMFFDFSSAFNTIQPHLLSEKLFKMNVPSHTILWIQDYMTDRPQFVRLKPKGCDRQGRGLGPADHSGQRAPQHVSDIIHTNTGAAQGTVLSPFLFTLYTADCRSTYVDCEIDKYADDTALTGKITDDDDSHYRQEIVGFVQWCDDNFLQLNVEKTKEMIIDFRKSKSEPGPVVIKGGEVERVTTYKYLGVTFDDNLTWRQNTDSILRKAHTRMYCLRKLKSFDVSIRILQVFYSSVIVSVLTFGAVCWGGNITKQDKDRIEKIIKKAGNVVGRRQETFDTLYNRRLTQKLTGILCDNRHPLSVEFESRQSARTAIFRAPKVRTARYGNFFIPRAIKQLNEQAAR